MATKNASNASPVNAHGHLSDLGRVAIDVPAARADIGEYLAGLSKTVAELAADAEETALAGARAVEEFELAQAEDMAADERAAREQIARDQTETRQIAAKLGRAGITLGQKTKAQAVTEPLASL